ncbi:serine/threonine protein kinase [Flavobacteriaceae bacterium MAR_2010_105]|nr:serine/threonine protein kinase [Flavobacteriaceae bacterium MAR_2010_105]
MKSIKILKYKSSELNPIFNLIHSVQTDDSPFDRGGFGEVYFCNSINNTSISEKQVLKILIDDGTGSASRGYKTINKLQDKIRLYNSQLKQNNEKPIESINALGALPQFSFEGELNGKKVLGYSANLLEKSSWLNFSKIFKEDDLQIRKELRTKFYNLPLEIRLKMAYDLVEGFSHLQQMNFIYADLNPENFFVNQKEAKLCLIDYEGGAVNENPETYGKPGEWLAPEIQSQLFNSSSLIKVDLNTDTWAVAIGIHFMLFNFHPLFYLKTRGIKEMKDYFKNHKWPDADVMSMNFRKELQKNYEWYIDKIKNELPQSLFQGFSETINNGRLNPNRRLSYKQWINIIKGLMQPPTINSFIADKYMVIDGIPITLSWRVNDIHTLQINNGIGEVTNQNSVEVLPSINTKYKLKAIGHFGVTEKSLEIKVFPTPIMETIFVPAPKINEVVNLQINMPKFPSIDLSVEILGDGVVLNEQKMNLVLPSFNFKTFNTIGINKRVPQVTWRNVFEPVLIKMNQLKNKMLKKKI